MADYNKGIDMRRRPVIVVRSMGKESAYGRSHHPEFSEAKTSPAAVEIDKSTRGVNRMKYALHEAFHVAIPGMPEENVVLASAFAAKVLDTMGYSGDDDEMDEQFAGPPVEATPRKRSKRHV